MRTEAIGAIPSPTVAAKLILLSAAFASLVAAQEFERGCPRQVFAGFEIIDASAGCVVGFEDLAIDRTGATWVADGRRVLRFPSLFNPEVPADVVLGKPNFTSLEGMGDPRCSSNSDAVCWFDQATRLALDGDGRVWVATNEGLLRFSPPFRPTGTSADFRLWWAGINHLAVDHAENLWVGVNGCQIVRFSPPITASSLTDFVIGESTPGVCGQPQPGLRQFFQSSGFTFDLDGNLLVTDSASSRVLIFEPPFETFMAATRVIGQNDLGAFDPLPFESGGLAFPWCPVTDRAGRLWVIHNLFFVSMYRPPFSTGQIRDYWFDFFNETPGGPRLPQPLSARYQRLTATEDSVLFLFGTDTQSRGRVARIEVPVIGSGAVVSAASFRQGLSPGGIYSLFGTELGFPGGLVGKVADGRLETVVGKTAVTVNGERAPIFLAAENQINFQAPFDLGTGGPAEIEVWINGFRGPSESVQSKPTDPGVFLLGDGRPAVVAEDGTVGRLRAGRFAVAFVTGLGRVQGELSTGALTPTDRLYPTNEPVELFVGRLCQLRSRGSRLALLVSTK
jgi:uncharacterized protein (TIGR03437 family)